MWIRMLKQMCCSMHVFSESRIRADKTYGKKSPCLSGQAMLALCFAST